jgi:chemotaxis regulatin CheY-phosphate phosphatase CheZ
MDLVRRDLIEISEAIARTRVEIASIKPPTKHVDVDIPVSATEELDAIVTATEKATSEILAATEAIQESLWRLRDEPGTGFLRDLIQEGLNEVITACSFQDITGQRIQKVVQVLRFIEARVNSMIDIWEIDDEEIEEVMPPDGWTETRLLNGPQADAAALKQSDVDSIIENIDGLDSGEEAETVVEADDDLILTESSLPEEDGLFRQSPSSLEESMSRYLHKDEHPVRDRTATEEARKPAVAVESRGSKPLLPELSFAELTPEQRAILFG